MKALALMIILLAACQTVPSLTPFLVTEPVTRIVNVQQAATPLPTITPRLLFVSSTALAPQASSTAIPLLATLPPILPTETPGTAARLAAHQIPTHLLLGRPILGAGNPVVDRTYPYGGTEGGRLQVHHGVEFVNTLGMPLHAAAAGTVIFAGSDLTYVIGSETDYYGNLVIIQHDFLSPEDLPVFTLYGHMQHVAVQPGQRLEEGDVIGSVGESGIALGPHLHFEVRVGSPFDFGETRNPELWLRPFSGFGTLGGRVTNADGSFAYGITITAQSSQMTRKTYTYGDDSVNPDPALGENFTLGDLPADTYSVTVMQNGHERYKRDIALAPDGITWLDIQLSP